MSSIAESIIKIFNTFPGISTFISKFVKALTNPFSYLARQKTSVLTEINRDLITGSIDISEMQSDPFKAWLEHLQGEQGAPVGSYTEFTATMISDPVKIVYQGYIDLITIEPPVTITKVKVVRDELIRRINDFITISTAMSVTASAVSGSILNSVSTVYSTIANVLGFDTLLERLTGPLFDTNILTPLTQEYESGSQTAIPGVGEMINAARLELLDIDFPEPLISTKAASQLAKHGFDAKWSDILYRASLEPPNIMDVINAYARTGNGPPDKTEVKDVLTKLQATLNIDMARYGDYFLTRPFTAPSLIHLRTGYEVSAYTKADIEKWMRWQMISPEWWNSTLNSITQFAGRRFNTIYLTTVANEYMANMIDETVFRAKIATIYSDINVQNMIVRAYDERKDYLARKPKGTRISAEYALSIQSYVRMFRLGIVDMQRWTNIIGQTNLSDSDKTLLTAYARLPPAARHERLAETAYISFYKSGIQDRMMTYNNLRNAGYNDQDINLLLMQAEYEMKTKPTAAPTVTPTLTRAEVLKLGQEGKMLVQEVQNRLRAMGYSNNDISYLLNLHGMSYYGPI